MFITIQDAAQAEPPSGDQKERFTDNSYEMILKCGRRNVRVTFIKRATKKRGSNGWKEEKIICCQQINIKESFG